VQTHLKCTGNTLWRMRKTNFSENMVYVSGQILVLVLVSCRFFQPFWIFVLSKTIFSVNKDQGTKFSLRVTRISAKHPDGISCKVQL
jgi:hypothetical protein